MTSVQGKKFSHKGVVSSANMKNALETLIREKHKAFNVLRKGQVASSAVVYFDGIMIFGFEFGEANISFTSINHVAFKKHDLRFWGFALHFKDTDNINKIKATLFTMLKIYVPSAVRVYIYRQIENTFIPPFGTFSPKFQMEPPPAVQLNSLAEDLSTYLELLMRIGRHKGVMILFEL